ncbi:glycoside hydrolase family 26 protein [Kribbella sp. VKM Ac-2566]|uniref:glycoside hydrolase family 26 protein n=1 Tax=Kribbella sp. VKM Ac-2566 TaxID=2512218 RepID=UPI0010640F5C|nr:glycosyl hydrolase [Kribbella sp. VKM Ac-2566]
MMRRVAALLAAGLVISSLSAAPAVAEACGAADDLIPAQGAHFGAFADEDLDGVSEPAALEAKLSHKLGINHNFQHAGIEEEPIPGDIAAGRIPMISYAAGTEEVLRAKWTNGTLAADAVEEADALAAFCVPIFFRYSWEFELRYTDTELFKKAWKLFRDIFAERAPNVAFVWNPTWRAFIDTESGLADEFWPGAEYVDWVAADGYSRPRTDKPAYNYRSFESMFGPAYDFAVRYQKPFMVGETGVHRDETDLTRQAGYLDAARTKIKTSYPDLKAFLYFHMDGDLSDNHWRVDLPAGNPGLTALRGFSFDPYFNP